MPFIFRFHSTIKIKIQTKIVVCLVYPLVCQFSLSSLILSSLFIYSFILFKNSIQFFLLFILTLFLLCTIGVIKMLLLFIIYISFYYYCCRCGVTVWCALLFHWHTVRSLNSRWTQWFSLFHWPSSHRLQDVSAKVMHIHRRTVLIWFSLCSVHLCALYFCINN